MTGVDLSIVLCLHREGGLLAPTLRSLAEAARFAQADGLTLELVAVFDCADAATRDAYRAEARFFPCPAREISVEFASAGLGRNRGVEAASGRFICFADGDDLVSFNFFAALHAAAEAAEGARVAYMPGGMLLFGESVGLHWIPDLAGVGALNLLSSNPFVSRICLRREHALEVPSADAGAATFYAFEDWGLHCDLVAAGFDLRTVPDAALFYRRRAAGLSAQTGAVGAAAIPPSRLFHGPIYRDRCASDYRRWRNGAADGARAAARPLHDRLGAAMLAAARRLEPAIPEQIGDLPLSTPFSAQHKQIGAFYFEICAALNDACFERVLMSEAARATASPDCRALRLSLELARKPSLQIDADARRIVLRHDLAACQLLALKLVQSFSPEGRILLRDSPFAEAFVRRFAAALGRDHAIIFYSSVSRRRALSKIANLQLRDLSLWPG